MAAYRHHSRFMQGSPFIRAGHIIQRARRQHTSALVVGAASVAVPRSEISIRSVTRTVTVMMTVVRSHSWMMSRLVTAGGLFFCDQLSRGRSVLGCSRCWDLGWSSLIVLRLRHRNCEWYRGSKADSEYGRHLFHRFTMVHEGLRTEGFPRKPAKTRSVPCFPLPPQTASPSCTRSGRS